MREVKIIVSVFIIGIIATVIAFIINYKNIDLKNDSISKNNISSINYKYDINKTLNELNLQTADDYKEYLNELKSRVKPQVIQSYINISDVDAKIYKRANITQKKTGIDIEKELVSSAYYNILCIVVKKNQSWDGLPLTNYFMKKFDEKDGCIKEFDFKYNHTNSLSAHNFKDKTFSVERSYVPDDAYDKYSKEVIDYMIEYNGAYNLDYYNYEYILDENGYLDDIKFIDITPIVVEGRDFRYSGNS